MLEIGNHPKIDEAWLKYTNQLLALFTSHLEASERELIEECKKIMLHWLNNEISTHEAYDLLSALKSKKLR